MRQFKHLSSETIRSIYVGYITREPKLAIARRLSIANSTVHYHLNQVKHLSEQEIVQLIAPRCPGCEESGHRSFKCLVCSKAYDNVRGEEYQTIRKLRLEIVELRTRLSKYEKTPTTSGLPNPITVVIG